MRTPQHLVPVHLDTDESPTEHVVADVGAYDADIALLNYLLQDLRVIARQTAAGGSKPVNYEAIEWDVHGLARRTVICDVDALIQPETRHMVGFFGDRRAETPGVDVDGTELDILSQFRHYPGIISYSSIELIGGQWANLVVHAAPSDRHDWRESQVHIAAAEELAPRIYHNVRIHNGCILGGPVSSNTITIETTKYWDYDVSPTWHAFRTLPGGMTETVDSPIATA